MVIINILITILAIIGGIKVFTFLIIPIIEAILTGITYSLFDFIISDKQKVKKQKIYCIWHFLIKMPLKYFWDYLSDPMLGKGTTIESSGWSYNPPYKIKKMKKNENY
jgi:hypothetical protein